MFESLRMCALRLVHNNNYQISEATSIAVHLLFFFLNLHFNQHLILNIRLSNLNK
jgi:hypothetical protein